MEASARGIKIVSGSAHEKFAREICEAISLPMAERKIFRFSDGEVGLSLQESVRGIDAFVIQSTCQPVNENLMELLIIIDALKRASAWRINVVLPYFGYARQDRKARPREPITAKLVANLLQHTGADRVITADLHAGQIQGFFDIPVDHLTGIPLLALHFKRILKDDLKEKRVVTVSPDIGGVVRARSFAELINSEIAIVDKRRSYDVANKSEVMDIIGKVRGKKAILVDDIVDTAGSVVNAGNALVEHGADKVYACAVHGVLSGEAVQRIERSCFEEMVLTDTIPLSEEKRIPKITTLSIAPLFAEAIRRVHLEQSVSILFQPKAKRKQNQLFD
ncbi:MAG: ribose-phosphate pyrophosphokinase [Synergistaceae bacterium]|jgi:ribose-phosphate pyrophosphokinase|nr:ribose-phosphate pyrophosphokinase [Synergistaceae bacterium]